MQSFIAELKRRNVVRAALPYIGAAWALAQGAARLLPVFDVPIGVVRACASPVSSAFRSG